jgi:hypothetical protein
VDRVDLTNLRPSILSHRGAKVRPPRRRPFRPEGGDNFRDKNPVTEKRA